MSLEILGLRRRLRCTVSFLACCTLIAQGHVYAQVEDSLVISVEDPPKLHELPVHGFGEDNVLGWDIILRIQDHAAVDIDLAAYSHEPKDEFSRVLCSSEGVNEIERCRIDYVDLKEAWSQGGEPASIWLVVYSAGGRGTTHYVYEIRALRGPEIAGTALYASDADERTLRPGSKEANTFFGFGQMGFLHLYRVEVPPGTEMQEQDLRVRIAARDAETRLGLSIYDAEGRRSDGSKTPENEQVLAFEAAAGQEFFALVGLESDVPSRRGVEYEIEVMGFEGSQREFELARAEFLEKEVRIIKDEVYYKLYVPGGDLALVVLEGGDFDLSIYPDTSLEDRVEAYRMSSSAQYVPLGSPLGSSQVVLSYAENGHYYLIHAKREETRFPRPGRLSVRKSPELYYLLKLSSERLERLDLKDGRTKVTEGGQRGFVYALPPIEEYFRAEFESGSERFDIALGGEFGEVIDIGADAVSWSGSSEHSPKYLVVFPDPFEGQGGGRFRLRYEAR